MALAPETKFKAGVQKPADFSASARQYLPGPSHFRFPPAFRHLQLLAEALASGCASPRLNYPLTLEQLDMLEAELLNQRILRLSPDLCSLTQTALHECSVWRWRAVRFRLNADGICFSIHVPSYVICRAEKVASELTGEASQGARSLTPAAIAQLDYLNRFAAYLCGEFDSPKNKYQQGLNIVLRALAGPRGESGSGLGVTLPISVAAFLRQVREAIEEASVHHF